MKKYTRKSAWTRSFERGWVALNRIATATAIASRARVPKQRFKPTPTPRKAPAENGAWVPGVVMSAAGLRRYRLYCPPGVEPGERLPMLVMLHGCGQGAESFAVSTRMNRVATRERFCVLYPEQDRMANAQRCWNWFETSNGRAYGEAAWITRAVDQVCLLHPVDPTRVAIVGMSAGASMAALLVTRDPARFKAVVMHSGIPPGTAHSKLSALSAMRGRRPTMPLAVMPSTTAGRWPPLLVIHGDGDSVVSPYNAWAAVRTWAFAAGAAAGTARIVRRGQRYPMSVTDFKHKGRTVATLVAVERLAHAWSGGAASQPFGDAQGPDASRMAWAFAVRQFRLGA